jgi:hypothetical protein
MKNGSLKRLQERFKMEKIESKIGEISINKLLFNFFLDHKKKEIDKIERANLLRKYIRDNNISERQLAKELGMSHSTLQDWCMYSRISREEYDSLIKKGYSNKQIYKVLRSNKRESDDNFKKKVYLQAIKDCQSKLRPMIRDGNILSNNEVSELKEVKNLINRIIIHYERGLK